MHIENNFDYIVPQKVDLKDDTGYSSFYYMLPVKKTLGRMLKNESLRKWLIQEPVFFKNNVCFDRISFYFIMISF